MSTTNTTEGTVDSTSGTLPSKIGNNATITKPQYNNVNKNTQGNNNNNSSRSQNKRNNYYTSDKIFKVESTAMNRAVFGIHAE